jgi:N-glycosylase/DNA lyase
MGYFMYENVKLVYTKVKEFLERSRKNRKDLSVKI